MKKLTKLSLHQLNSVELDERKMCRILGGGTPGNCQCGCHYANNGGSSTASNGSANNASGLWSDPTAETPSPEPEPNFPKIPPIEPKNDCHEVDALCVHRPPRFP